jgi:hypothetical protein
MLRVAILLWILGTGAVAQAGTITAGDVKPGSAIATLADGTSLSAWADAAGTRAAGFGRRSQGGLMGFGVAGAGNDEIDHLGDGGSEMVRVAFTGPSILASITIGLLFDGPEYGDRNETAAISFGGLVGTLRAVATDLAEWTVGGRSRMVAGCAAGTTSTGGAGCFEIRNPFGNRAADRLEFTALASGAADESDFLVAAIRYVSVTEPGSLALLGLTFAFWLTRSRR